VRGRLRPWAISQLGFRTAHERQVHWLGLQRDGGYRPIERTKLIAVGPDALADRIDRPA
jgi:hypothetical protein